VVAHRFALRVIRRAKDPARYQAAAQRFLDRLPGEYEMLTKEGAARTASMNRQLAWSMAFVAGAVNAGGFLAVAHYTSHMTGVASQMADATAIGDYAVMLTALGMMICFMGGAFTSTVLVSLGKRRRMPGRYALSLLVESGLLLAFGYLGARLQAHEVLDLELTGAVALLCFIMGMHNAVTTNISGAQVRTTHMTGNVTDIGIELAKLAYINTKRHADAPPILADRGKLKLVGLLLVSFLLGGVVGALGFKHIGFKTVLPLAAFLCFLAARPALLELRLLIRHVKRDLHIG
ncbi:MAG TPA: YoaK family protein, partial [Holophagaceae bacterium]|nr:YoaK family protein [Holophagaceae bacterium]